MVGPSLPLQGKEKSIAHLKHLTQRLSHVNVSTLHDPGNIRLLGQVDIWLFLDAHCLWGECFDSPCRLDCGTSQTLE